MNYQDYIYQILGFVGLPALFTLYLTERVKASVKGSFDEKLEGVKKENMKEIEEVKKEHSKEISQFQTELNHLKSKENFKFTKLHEKRLEVLEKTYYHINEASDLLDGYVSPIAYNEEKSEKFKDSYIKSSQEWLAYFKQNCIYFDTEIENLLQKYFKESIMIFAIHLQNQSDRDNWNSLKLIQEKLIPIKKQIETKFRELLGE